MIFSVWEISGNDEKLAFPGWSQLKRYNNIAVEFSAVTTVNLTLTVLLSAAVI